MLWIRWVRELAKLSIMSLTSERTWHICISLDIGAGRVGSYESGIWQEDEGCETEEMSHFGCQEKSNTTAFIRRLVLGTGTIGRAAFLIWHLCIFLCLRGFPSPLSLQRARRRALRHYSGLYSCSRPSNFSWPLEPLTWKQAEPYRTTYVKPY